MNEEIVFRISFIITIVGLILFFTFYQEEFPQKSISELIDSNSSAKVFGVVDYIIIQNENTLFTLSNDQKINVFYPAQINIEKGDFVYVYGKITTYKGELEILAQKVVKE